MRTRVCQFAVLLMTTVLAHAETDAVERVVRIGFEVKNSTGAMVEGAYLYAYAPLLRTSSQDCLELKVSAPYELLDDALGNRILKIPLRDLVPYSTRMVTCEARLRMHAAPRPVVLGDDTALWLREESLMPWRDHVFALRGPRFRRGTDAALPRMLAAWVSDSLSPAGYLPEDRGARYALTAQRGDCTEYACLFVALCRRFETPARVMGGYTTDRNRNLHPIGYHNWAEVQDGDAWQIADPLRRIYGERTQEYVAMRVLGDVENPLKGRTQVRVEGEGLHVRMMTWETP